MTARDYIGCFVLDAIAIGCFVFMGLIVLGVIP